MISNKKTKNIKTKNIKTKNKKTKNKKTKNKEKEIKCLVYFSMVGCPYCNGFEPLWNETIKKYPNLDMFTIQREKEPKLMDKLSIKSYPTILLVKGNNIIKYEYDRKPRLIKKFLVENNII